MTDIAVAVWVGFLVGSMSFCMMCFAGIYSRRVDDWIGSTSWQNGMWWFVRWWVLATVVAYAVIRVV